MYEEKCIAIHYAEGGIMLFEFRLCREKNPPLKKFAAAHKKGYTNRSFFGIL